MSSESPRENLVPGAEYYSIVDSRLMMGPDGRLLGSGEHTLGAEQISLPRGDVVRVTGVDGQNVTFEHSVKQPDGEVVSRMITATRARFNARFAPHRRHGEGDLDKMRTARAFSFAFDDRTPVRATDIPQNAFSVEKARGAGRAVAQKKIAEWRIVSVDSTLYQSLGGDVDGYCFCRPDKNGEIVALISSDPAQHPELHIGDSVMITSNIHFPAGGFYHGQRVRITGFSFPSDAPGIDRIVQVDSLHFVKPSQISLISSRS